MVYCKTFIDGINSINFQQHSAQIIRNALMAYAYQDLLSELTHVQKERAELPESSSLHPLVEAPLAQYKEKLEHRYQAIETQIQRVLEMARALEIDLEHTPPLDDFIPSLAAHFRNIRHLADTLSDAPAIIKTQQTRLFTEVLFKLDAEEQALQLRTLSLSNMIDMIHQAMAVYDQTTDVVLRGQSQTLVHMGIYEIIRRECDKLKSAPSLDDKTYQDMFRALRQKLPDVGSSSIIDTLSDYKSSDGLSIQDLLTQVDKAFDIAPMSDWRNPEKIQSLIQKKSLFHQLRFGQDDRREYVKKTKDNLARDLFWARNIRDIELFTKGRVSDEVFLGISQRAALTQCTTFEPSLEGLNELTVAEKRLYSALQAVKEFCRESKGNRFGSHPKDKSIIEAKFKQSMLDKFKRPTLKIRENAIVVELYSSTLDPDDFIERVFRSGGFGRNLEELIPTIRNEYDNQQIPRIEGIKLSGRSFEEIAQQIDGLKDVAIREVYKAQFEKMVAESTRFIQAPNIEALGLGNSEEILLRKLLELHYIAPMSGITDHPAIVGAFKKMATGDFLASLKVTDLESAVHAAYLQLATMDESEVSASKRPIIQKSKRLKISREERVKTLQTLEAVFSSEESSAQKVEQIHRIFRDEYTLMSSTMGSHDADRLSNDILGMATEIVRLVERTDRGEPTLTESEQTAYFSIVNQVAAAIYPTSIQDVHFKVKHSLTGLQHIQIHDAHGPSREIEINIGQIKLPYSLVKPLGNDFIFSFGGTRGMVAPFEGLDLAYAGEGKQKGRLFTHSRLLGVGQYGSVKEVESLLTGLNQVIKKGYVPSADNTPTFSDANRNDLRTRPITARDDTLYRIENDVLQGLSEARQAAGESTVGRTRYWIESDKERHAGRLFSKEGAPQQYQILTERAKGDTFADTANKQLNKYTKGDIAYHDPLKRENDRALDDLKERLGLAQACVVQAQRFASLGFAHNDIKPENFLYKQTRDGAYDVRYIDWATGGFEQVYQGSLTNLPAVFAEIFGLDLTVDSQTNQCVDQEGRFVKIQGNQIRFGINPTLQILHGARNGTLPYISPKVLGDKRALKALPGGELNVELDTKFSSSDPMMDDWALTAMAFGVCNRQAYFALVKGRVVSDYVVPGILEMDGERPLGLKIVDAQKFNDYFACDADRVTDIVLKSGDVYRETQAVMYIPSTQREGEPLHLYRRLQAFQADLKAKALPPESPEQHLCGMIQSILDRVHRAVASGEGLSKEALRETLSQTQQCIRNYEALNDPSYQEKQLKSDIFQSVIQQNQQKAFTADALLEKIPTLRRMTVLCTYPTTPSQQQEAVAILDKVLNEAQLNDKFLSPKAPCQDLFKACITANQHPLLNTLLSKITTPNAAFIERVRADGLLHYAAQQGMTDSFVALTKALVRAGASNPQMFDLMMNEYGPGDSHLHGANHIQWSTNVFHAAIRNDNATQLSTVLDFLPQGHDQDPVIFKALHFCAVLGHQERFKQLLEKYNTLNPNHPLTVKELLTIQLPPDNTSPYHLFLRDEATLEMLDWTALQKDATLVQSFLLTSADEPSHFPMLIAAKGGNFKGVARLLALAKEHLSQEQWQQLLLQTDDKGKNILNYVLEHGQLSFLSALLNTMKEQSLAPEVTLIHLLGNPHPANPIKNFLAFEKSEAQQFQTIKQLLDTLCEHFESASLQQQQARVVAFLVNQDWLIQQAENPNHHQALISLMHNEALSLPLKNVLFSQLSQAAPENSLAKQFYNQRIDEISWQEAPEALSVPLDISTAILQEVAKQNNDASALVSALTAGYQLIDAMSRDNKRLSSTLEGLTRAADTLSQQLKDLAEKKEATEEARQALDLQLKAVQMEQQQLQQANATLLEKNSALASELQALSATSAALSGQLNVETARAQTIEGQLGATREQLQLTQAQVASLKQAEATADVAHKASVAELERLIVSRHEESQQLLDDEKSRHSQEMSALSSKLSAEIAKFDSFEEQLGTTQQALQSALSKVAVLKKTSEAAEAAHAEKIAELKKEMASGHEGAQQTLDAEKARHSQAMADLSNQLEAESANARALEVQLSKAQSTLELTLSEVAALRQRGEETEVTHKAKVTELESLMTSHQEEFQQRLAAEKAAHAKEMAGLSTALASSVTETARLKEDLASQNKRFADSQSRVEELSQASAALAATKEQLERELVDGKQARLVAEQALSAQVLQLQQANAALLEKNGALASKLQVLSETSTTLSGQLNVETARAQTIEGQLGATREQLQSTKAQVASLKQEEANADATHKAIVAELKSKMASGQKESQQQLEEERSRHSQEMSALSSKLDTKSAEVLSFKEQLRDTQQVFQSALSQVAALKKSSEATEAAHAEKIAELEKEIASGHEGAQQSLDAEKARHSQAMAALSSQLEARNAEAHALKAQLSKAQSTLELILSEVAALRQRGEETEVTHKAKMTELESLMASHQKEFQQRLAAEKAAHAKEMAGLSTALASSATETARLKEALASQDKRFTDSQSRVEELSQASAALAASKEQLERELAEGKQARLVAEQALSAQVLQLQQGSAILFEKNGALASELQAFSESSAVLSGQLNVETAKVQAIEGQLGATREQLQLAQAQVASLKQAEVTADVAHKASVAELERLIVSRHEESQQLLDDEKSRHSQEMSALSSKLIAEIAKVDSFEEQLIATQQALQSALSKVAALKKSSEAADVAHAEKIAELEKEVASGHEGAQQTLDAEKARHSQAMAALSSQLEARNAEAHALKAQLSKAQSTLELTLSEVAVLRQGGEEAEVTHKAKVTELESLMASHQEEFQQRLAAEKAAHAKEMAGLSTALASSATETARLKEDLASQNKRFADSQSRVEELSQASAALAATKEQLERELVDGKQARLVAEQALSAQVLQLQQGSAILFEKNGALASELQAFSESSAVLSGQLNVETAKVQAIEGQLGATREQLQLAQAQVASLKQAEVTADVAHKASVAELERLIVSRHEESQQLLDDEKSRHSQEMSALSSKLIAEIAKVDSFEEQLIATQQALQSALSKVAALKKSSEAADVAHAEKIAELEKEIASGHEGAQQILDAEKARHSQAMAALSSQLEARNAEAHALKAQLSKAQSTLELTLSEVAVLRQGGEEAEVTHKAKVTELESLMASHQEEFQQRLAAEKAAHAKEMAGLSAALASSVTETARLKEALASQDKRFTDSQSQVLQLQQANATLLEKNGALASKLQAIEGQFGATREQLQLTKAQVAALEQEQAAADATHKVSVAELESRMASGQKEAQQWLEDEKSRHSQEMSALSSELSAEISKVHSFEEQLGTTQRALQSALSQVAALRESSEAEKAAHAEKIADLKKEMASGHEGAQQNLDAEKARHLQVMADISSQLETESAKARALEAQLSKAQSTLELTLSEVASLRQQGEEAEATHAKEMVGLRSALASSVTETAGLTEALASQDKRFADSQSQMSQLQHAHVALLEKNSALASELQAFRESSAALSGQLNVETAKVQGIEGQLEASREQLQLMQAQVASLKQEEASAVVAHKASVAELESQMASGQKEAQQRLEAEKSRHSEAMAALQLQLEASLKKSHDVEDRLASQGSGLAASQSRVAEVEKALAEMLEQNQQLKADLNLANVASADMQKEFEQRWVSQQAMLETTQRTLLDTQRRLETAGTEKAELSEQVMLLRQDNAALTSDVTRLSRESQDQQARFVEKQQELERLQAILRQVAEEKAVMELCHGIALILDIDVLQRLARVQDNTHFQGLPMDRAIVDALYSPNAYIQIRETALRRLNELETKAMAALKETVSKSTIRAQITAVANAQSNADLQAAELDPAQIAALHSDRAYEALIPIARARLQLHTDTLEHLRQLIQETNDIHHLQAIAGAKNNGALLAIANLPPQDNALIDEEAYQTITAAALEKIRHMPPAIPRSAALVAQDKAIEALKKIIATTKDRALLMGLQRAQNNEDLYLDDLDLKWVAALVEEHAYVTVSAAAEVRIEQLRVAREIKRTGYLDENRYATVLGDDQALLDNMQKRLDAIQRVDSKIHEDLKRLGRLQPFHWFNPGFQAAAKKNANEMAVHFEQLAEELRVLLAYMKPLRWELKDQLESIPTQDMMAHLGLPHIKRLQERRQLLTQAIQHVEKELALYNPVDKLLNGDFRATHPLLKQGLLKTLHQAQAEKGDLKLHAFDSSTEDFPITALADHMKQDYVSRPTVNHATALTRPVAGDSSFYEVVPRENVGEFREHTIDGGKPTVGRFIELHASSYATSNPDDLAIKRNAPDIKIIINKFPTPPGTDPNLPESPALIEARIKFSLGVASQLLAGLAEAPTVGRPILLTGSNAIEQRYIWTALMILGKSLPKMQFDERAIRVIYTAFSPEAEMGRFFGFSKTSCYETHFKPNMALVRNLMGGMIEIDENKFGHHQPRQQVKSAVTHMNSIFNEKLKPTYDVLKEEQDRHLALDR